jgi:glycosyltransferase involved in cell wall biosynthesis
MPRVHQVVASLGYGDAIGNATMGIQRALRRAGFESEIYVESADPRLESQTRDYRDLVDDIAPDDVLIHHFSIGSRASRTAYAVPGRMILVFHNITPPQYFLGEHSWLVRQTYHGRRELLAYRSRVDLALGVSEFNRQELEGAGFPATGVLPVVPDFSHLNVTPDVRVYDTFDDETTNILFVGRLIGNKRPDNLIRYAHAYRLLFNPDARLIIAGSHAHFGDYLAELHAFAARLGAGNVHLLGQVTNEELTALYDIADVFLCASEHEGFCVPIVEAFYKRVPVIARAAAAVPATMDGGGLLYETEDPLEVAGLIDAVIADEALEDRILRAQDGALDRLRARDFDSLLLGFVRQALAAPPRQAPTVDSDFWRQFRLADELEAVRESRPSAFHALPAETPSSAKERMVAHVGDRR